SIIIISTISKPSYLNSNNHEDNENLRLSASLEGSENIIVTELERTATISSFGLINIEDEITFRNLNNNPITSVFVGIPKDLSDDLIFFKTTGINKNTLLTERPYMIMNNYEMLVVFFNSPLLPHQSKTIKFFHIYNNQLIYQNIGDQIINYTGFVYPLLPYKLKGSIKATFELPPDIPQDFEGGWGLVDIVPRKIYYFFENILHLIDYDFITPFLENFDNYREILISYTDNDATKMEMKEVNRDIFISPWGIIRVKEEFLIQNIGTIDFNTFELDIPIVAENLFISDDLGEVLGTRFIDTESTKHQRIRINLLENRILMTPNSSFRFFVEYSLPYENYVSLNWFQETIHIDLLTTVYDYLGRDQTINVIIDGCYTINSNTEIPDAIKTFQGAIILIYNSDFVTPVEKKVIQITFTIDLFNILLRPIIFILIICLIALTFVLLIKVRKKEYDKATVIREFIPVNEIREFCSLYEEKNALTLEIRRAEEDTKRRKMAKKNYKSILDKNTSKIDEIQKEIVPFKKIIIDTSDTFENIIKKLDVLEAERVSVKDGLNLLEFRYKKGKLPSKAVYVKLSDGFKKRRKKIDRTIDKLIQQLRNYTL
ncbi:MAG: hypothetical protein ACFFDN_19650, partial [Candidatus Hodarchaeota archaeon]